MVRPTSVNNLRPCPQPCHEAAFELPLIVAARPTAELMAHVRNFKVPSLQLLGRSIKVLCCSLVKFHLYDRVLLLRPEALVFSLNGKVQVINNSGRAMQKYHHVPHFFFTVKDLEPLDKGYPYLLKKAHYFEVKEGTPKINSPSLHKYRYLNLNEGFVAKIPEFGDYKKINVKSVTDYFKTYHHLSLNPRTLFHSKYLEKKSYEKLHHFQNF